MPIEPVKIPQNVYIEDKVVGPLSLRQIIIIAIGGGFSYMIFASVQKAIGAVPLPLTILLWTPAAIAAAFALVNINDLSLLRICFLFLERMQKPTKRIWSPRPGISITIRTTAKEEQPKKAASQGPSQANTEQRIRELSTVVDTVAPVSTEAVPDVETETDPLRVAGSELRDSETRPSTSLRAGNAQPETESQVVSPALPKPPVNPDRIRVDQPAAAKSSLSDLSVFRDIFPPNTAWHS